MEVESVRFLEEVSEDAGLIRAMEEAEGSPFVSRDEVMRILAAAALTPGPSPSRTPAPPGEGRAVTRNVDAICLRPRKRRSGEGGERR